MTKSVKYSQINQHFCCYHSHFEKILALISQLNDQKTNKKVQTTIKEREFFSLSSKTNPHYAHFIQTIIILGTDEADFRKK